MEKRSHIVPTENPEERDHIRDLVEGKTVLSHAGFEWPIYLRNVFNKQALWLRVAVDSLDYDQAHAVDGEADQRARWNTGAQQTLAPRPDIV
jgi:hypothetical protein